MIEIWQEEAERLIAAGAKQVKNCNDELIIVVDGVTFKVSHDNIRKQQAIDKAASSEPTE